jgi:hypothetical protein
VTTSAREHRGSPETAAGSGEAGSGEAVEDEAVEDETEDIDIDAPLPPVPDGG